MLDYQILSNKKSIIRNGEEIKDLLSESFNKDVKSSGSLLMVNKYYIARPDLISLAVYGDDKYADIICKINGISNPFELNIGKILFIPNFDYITNCLIINDLSDNNDIISKDNNELMMKQKTYQKKPKERRSPNQQIIGDSNFIIDKSNGIIFY